ncbi:sensor histidine kinase [Bdellovibrio sp. HCB2-146]|uniref:sensor histidine kinase n=1 Tax=Bdellovibrio sp. HCB2-146 TaxID=3394362 RepID=UPI0039BC3AF4
MKQYLFILTVFVVSFAYAFSVKKIQFEYLDALFLDLKTVGLSKQINESDSVFLNLSDLKEAGQGTLNPKIIPELIKAFRLTKDAKIIFAIPEREFEPKENAVELLKPYADGSNTLFYSRWRDDNYSSFGDKRLEFKTSIDNVNFAHDMRSRRLFISADKSVYDPTLVKTTSFLELNLPELKNINSFEFLGTKQAFLRFYKLLPQQVVSGRAFLGDPNILNGKKVFVGTEDTFSVYFSRSVMDRFFGTEKADSFSISDAELMLHIYENLKNRSYIGVPSDNVTISLIAVAVGIALYALVALNPVQFIFVSFAVIFVTALLNIFLYVWLNLNLEFTRILVGIFLVQYFGLPYLLIRTLKRASVERISQEKSLAQERAKRRFLVQAAVADSSLRTVAQVSHDIRSPLMALQIAHRVIKDGISQEAGDLIQGSIDRLKYIAEDTLMKFRNETTQREADVVLREALLDLAETFKVLYPEVEFRFDVSPDIRLLWPEHSLARAFTNLFNNSIEAFGSNRSGLMVTVLVEPKEDQYVIRVQDNGPGIPENIIPKLFQSGATFGKETGTGLGLYQVRKDLEDFGGRIRALTSSQGALFEITLPRYLEKIGVPVTKSIVAVAEVDLPLQGPPDVELVRLPTLQAAREYFGKFEDLSNFTLMLDLVFPNEEETAFDLIEFLGPKKPFKIFICTSLGENEEIRKLSDKYDVLLVTRSLLSRFVLKVS